MPDMITAVICRRGPVAGPTQCAHVVTVKAIGTDYAGATAIEALALPSSLPGQEEDNKKK